MADEKTINLHHAYVVCSFFENEDDEESVGVVPNTWLVDAKSCRFPPYSNQFKINKAIINKEEPCDNWKLWDIVVMSAHGKQNLFSCDIFCFTCKVSDVDILHFRCTCRNLYESPGGC